MSITVLLVEDDDLVAPMLIQMLERAGYAVTHVGTGSEALAHTESEFVDVVLLDLGLPDLDGLEVCRRMRAAGYEGAVVILTGRDGELERVVGFDAGADDYLAKPFSLAELMARMKAVMRRGWAARALDDDQAPPAPTPASTPAAAVAAAPPADSAGLLVDVRGRRVKVGGSEVSLTAKEFDVLALLDQERGAVVTRERLMDEVWDENWFGSTKTLDATVGRLRQKLEAAGSPVAVGTVRGVGFRLEDA